MALLANLVFFLAIPAAIAAAMAYALANLATGWSIKARTVAAALIAGGLPIAVPITALASASGYDGELMVPVVALLVGGAFIALVIGFPVALMIGRRLAAKQSDKATFD